MPNLNDRAAFSKSSGSSDLALKHKFFNYMREMWVIRTVNAGDVVS